MKELEQKIQELEKINKELVLINSELETGIEYFTQELEKEMRKNIGDKILLEYYQRLFNGVVANYLLDPEPIELHTQGNKAGASNSHLIQIKNIVAVTSDRRMKKIFLTKPQKPLQGGTSENPLIINSDESNWYQTLFSIQNNQQFLFRVHKSFAINIFHYCMTETKTFELHEELKKASNPLIHSIPTDANFDSISYHKRLLEIKQLFDHQVGFALDYQKLDEITRYIKTTLVTNG
jgi:hypothetical protein